MNTDQLTIRETTQRVIAGMSVGVSNIWARELPDDNGVVASRVSATVTIHDPASGQSREQKVFAGSVLDIGSEHYSVVGVQEGTKEPGDLTLRKR
jgi:hypothetical protein